MKKANLITYSFIALFIACMSIIIATFAACTHSANAFGVCLINAAVYGLISVICAFADCKYNG